MYNIFKYNYISYLEGFLKKKFKLSSGEIYVLPPIIKRVGLFFCVCFPVVNKNTNYTINRPIGLVCVNKNGKIKTYDFFNNDFCSETDFNKPYYNIFENNFWPNLLEESLEQFRINLQLLNKVFAKTNLITGYNKKDYKKYIDSIKILFPKNYFKFYTLLEQNKIEETTQNLLFERNQKLLVYKKQEEEKSNNNNIIKSIELAFKKDIFKTLKKFTREEIIPSFKEIGTYSKLLFYKSFGNFIKNFNEKSYENCYSLSLSKKERENNKEKLINKLKVQIIKLYSKSIDTPHNKNNNIDTLSKILIVFLNCLLIEEKNKSCLKEFEEQINESREIFDENIKKIEIEEAKQNLEEFYNDLNNDYLQENKSKFSNLFSAYLFIFG